jgi:hypothetical protein
MKFQDRKDSPLVTFDEGFAVRLKCAHSVPLSWFVPSGAVGVNDKGATAATAAASGGGDAGEGEGTLDSKSKREAVELVGMKNDIKGELDIIIVADCASGTDDSRQVSDGYS